MKTDAKFWALNFFNECVGHPLLFVADVLDKLGVESAATRLIEFQQEAEIALQNHSMYLRMATFEAIFRDEPEPGTENAYDGEPEVLSLDCDPFSFDAFQLTVDEHGNVSAERNIGNLH